MMKYHSEPNVLVIPRPDGLLIAIDGKCYMKQMTSKQYVHLANDCNTAAIAVMRNEETETSQQKSNHSVCPL